MSACFVFSRFHILIFKLHNYSTMCKVISVQDRQTDKSEEKLTFVTRFVRDRHKKSKRPSTFFKKKGDVASRFVSSIPGEEFGQDLRESEPGDLLPGSGRKKQFSL